MALTKEILDSRVVFFKTINIVVDFLPVLLSPVYLYFSSLANSRRCLEYTYEYTHSGSNVKGYCHCVVFKDETSSQALISSLWHYIG